MSHCRAPQKFILGKPKNSLIILKKKNKIKRRHIKLLLFCVCKNIVLFISFKSSKNLQIHTSKMLPKTYTKYVNQNQAKDSRTHAQPNQYSRNENSNS